MLTAAQSWADRIAGSDPGFNRLLLATRGALTIALALGAEWLFVRGTGALQAAETALAPTGGPPSDSVLVLRGLALLDGSLAATARGAGLAVRSPGTEVEEVAAATAEVPGRADAGEPGRTPG